MKKLICLAALAASVSFTACNDHEPVNNVMAEQTLLQLKTVGLNYHVSARAGILSANFSNGEEIGVFIYDQSESGGAVADLTAKVNYNDIAANGTENVKYKQGSPWSADAPIQLSSNKGTVYAYYPYVVTSTNATAVPVTVNVNQGTGQSEGNADVAEQTDYMWATPVQNISNANYSISDLKMNHALAMVSFQFKNHTDADKKYPGAGIVSSIKLQNKSTMGDKVLRTGDATMNISNGSLTQAAGTEAITLTPAAETLMDIATPSKLPRMLVYPMATIADDDLELIIVMDGNTYTIPITTTMTDKMLAGNNYVFTFTFRGKNLEIAQVSITPWITQDIDAGEVSDPTI